MMPATKIPKTKNIIAVVIIVLFMIFKIICFCSQVK